jgi:hypothetical protein
LRTEERRDASSPNYGIVMSPQRRSRDVDDEFLTVAEVAPILKFNQQTIRNWILSTVFGVDLALTGFTGGVSTPRPERQLCHFHARTSRKNEKVSAVEPGLARERERFAGTARQR